MARVGWLKNRGCGVVFRDEFTAATHRGHFSMMGCLHIDYLLFLCYFVVIILVGGYYVFSCTP